MGTPNTKNLGLVKAIHVGVNPPLNTKMLWYNINPNENRHYYFDVVNLVWKPLTSSGGGGTPTTYTFQDTNTVDMTQVGSTVSAAVKISAQTGNIVTQLLDGLYASETLTSFDSFTLIGTVLSMTYTDELDVQVTRTVNLASALTDVKLQSASLNSSNYILTLTQTDGSTVTVNLSELRKISTVNTSSIKLEGDGTPSNQLKASAIISNQVGNILSVLPDGLFASSGGSASISRIKIFNIESNQDYNLSPLNQLISYLNTFAPIQLLSGEIAFINFMIDNDNIIQFSFGPGAGIYGMGGTAVN
ncbi:MAG TPA: hypothetical protein PKI46_10160, partial [Bacteroidales bacterium]|nr:hypothetical protein [Bacteroidales bacterium]